MYLFRSLLLLLCFTPFFAPLFSKGSSFKKFNSHLHKGKMEQAKKVLDNWGENKENDPQYYICSFNYYVEESRTSGMAIQNEPSGENFFEISDPETGEVTGYMVEDKGFNQKNSALALDYIRKGIEKFPNHYEMRFGELWHLKEMLRLDLYLERLDAMMEYFKENKDEDFYWNYNEIIDDSQGFMIRTLQDAFYKFSQNDKIWEHTDFLISFNEIVIQHFPQHNQGYNNMGAVYAINHDFESAIPYFIRSSELDPKDSLVLWNIAYSYSWLDQTDKAIPYLQKIIELNNDEKAVEAAKQRLEEIFAAAIYK